MASTKKEVTNTGIAVATNHQGRQILTGDRVNAGSSKYPCWCTIVGIYGGNNAILMQLDTTTTPAPKFISYARTELDFVSLTQGNESCDELVNLWQVA